MKAEILKSKSTIGVVAILLVGAIVAALNFYVISPQNATEMIIKELYLGNEVFEVTEDQKQLINQVMFGAEEYDLPNLVMKFNKSVEIRKGLFQSLDIEEVKGGNSEEGIYRVAVRLNLKETIGEDGVPLTDERTFTGLVMLSLKKIGLREWKVEKVETIPFRDTSI